MVEIFHNYIFCLQESFLAYGRDALSNRNGAKQKEAMMKLGQAGLVLGAFAVAAFTIKQIFS